MLFDSDSTHTFLPWAFIDRFGVFIDDLGHDLIMSTQLVPLSPPKCVWEVSLLSFNITHFQRTLWFCRRESLMPSSTWIGWQGTEHWSITWRRRFSFVSQSMREWHFRVEVEVSKVASSPFREPKILCVVVGLYTPFRWILGTKFY